MTADDARTAAPRQAGAMTHELTPADLERITGRRRRTTQIAVLRSWGIEPFLGGDGRPVVMWSVIEDAQRRRSGLALAEVQRRGPRPRMERVK